MKKNILVLGSTGMLGSMVAFYLQQQVGLEVYKTSRKKTKKKTSIFFDVELFLKNPNKFEYLKDFLYIVNCIGIIKPYCKDNDPVGVHNAIRINALFPHELAKILNGLNTKVIQIATDCVYSGSKGKYVESDGHDALDVYGKTKSLGEVFDGNFLNIRCSIIGPELQNKLSLLEWFLAQPEGSELSGFIHHKWNGVTTLQFAQLCQQIIESDSFEDLVKESHIHHFTPNSDVNKYQLLKIFCNAFRKQHLIKSVNDIGPKVDRRLRTNYNHLAKLYNPQSMEKAVTNLKEFVDTNKFYELHNL